MKYIYFYYFYEIQLNIIGKNITTAILEVCYGFLKIFSWPLYFWTTWAESKTIKTRRAKDFDLKINGLSIPR